MDNERVVIDMEKFKTEALPVIEKLAGRFGISEPKAVEAYGHMLSLTVTHEDYRPFLDKSLEVLSYDACIDMLKFMTSKTIEALSEPEQRIGLCLGLLRERRMPILNVKYGRNDPCPCGSGVKYKRCCLGKNVETTAKSLLDIIPAPS